MFRSKKAMRSRWGITAIGRTDLAGGNHGQLIDALKKKVLTLPDDTQLLPGHGPFTTVAREKVSNPYIR